MPKSIAASPARDRGKGDEMPVAQPYEASLVTQVTLSYLSVAIEFLEDSEGFEIPKSRRLSSRWSAQLRCAGRGSSVGRAPAADAESSVAPPVPEVVTATTDLLVSAFREACSKIQIRNGSSDAVLDCVLMLAMKRAHEACNLGRGHANTDSLDRSRVTSSGTPEGPT